MTIADQNEAARQINQDVQRDNGMLPETAYESACKIGLNDHNRVNQDVQRDNGMLPELTHSSINPGGTLCCAELAEFDAHYYRLAQTVRMGNKNIQWRFCPWCGKPLENVQRDIGMISDTEALSRIGWNGHNT